MEKCAGNNESSKHKMSDNDRSNEKRSKMDRRIKILKEMQKRILETYTQTSEHIIKSEP